MLLCLLVNLAAPGGCPGGCAPNALTTSTAPAAHVARYGGGRNVGAVLAPDFTLLIEVPYPHAWTTPHGGWTLYPGEPGSGYGSWSDYSHIDWLMTPEQNAGRVRGRLTQLGIPIVAPETQFLGKNPAALDDVRLPVPRPKAKPPEKEPDKEPDK